jgi:D-methionine transport system substrate-binding protein
MKKILSLILALSLTVALAGCAQGSRDAVGNNSGEDSDKKIIRVGATPVPHKEILEFIKPLLAAEGYTLDIKEFTDYMVPNPALADGEIDANFFQHVPFLNKTIEERKLDLDYTVKVHIEPMGIYSLKVKSLDEIRDGATISIPNDSTNGSRALRVLESSGLIKLKSDALVSALDIIENPKNLKIQELDAAQLPRTLQDVDAAVINTNYAMEANLNPSKDALAIESADSPYANILAVRAKDKDAEYIKVLSRILTSSEVRQFIENKYDGNIVPAF